MQFRRTRFTLAVLLTISLAACGGGGNGGGNNDNIGDDGGDSGDGSNDNGPSLQQQAVNTGTVNPTYRVPDGIDDNAYFGAVDPDATADNVWWADWTYHSDQVDGSLKTPSNPIHPLEDDIGGSIIPAGSPDCTAVDSDFHPAGTTQAFGVTFPVCVITPDDLDNGDSATVTLTNDRVWVLDGFVSVGDGGDQGETTASAPDVTLKIEQGTMIVGATDTSGSLVITRGANLLVNGTADKPVVMSGVEVSRSSNKVTGIAGDITDLTDRGTFGGLVIDGWAATNAAGTPSGEAASEVVPSGITRFYGGGNNHDDSGDLEYLVIAESGVVFRADEEIQGLTLEGVGSGTDISYVQVLGSEDDGIEFFGGTADVDHVVINAPDDDALDMDLGYQGTIQYAIVRIGANNGNRGIESDNNGDAFQATPETSPILAYITILGNQGGSDITTAALHREGFQGDVYRSVYTDDLLTSEGTGQFENGCLDIDNTLEPQLQYRDVVFNCSPSNIAPDGEN